MTRAKSMFPVIYNVLNRGDTHSASYLDITAPGTVSVSNVHSIVSESLKQGPVMITVVPPS